MSSTRNLVTRESESELSELSIIVVSPVASPQGTHGSINTIQSSFEVSQERTPDFVSTTEYEARIMKEVCRYRLKYFFKQSCSSYTENVKRRILHGVEVYYVLLLLFLEKLAYASVIANITDPFLKILALPDIYTSLIQTALFEVVAQIMFPIAGLLGDRYIGRYQTAHLGLWLEWIGFASMTLFACYDNNTITSWNRYCIPLCFFLIAMGSAGFQANMIPFGADQITYKSSDELSSYFYWYYWVRNFGGSALIVSIQCSTVTFGVHVSMFGLLSTIAITAALIVNQLVNHRFTLSRERHNPLKTVYQVVKFVAAVKRPKQRSAFSYTPDSAPPSRIDLAKEIHGGIFTNAQVEDVKTVLRLLVVMTSLIGVLMVYTGIVNIIPSQIKNMNGTFVISSGTDNSCTFSDTFTWSFNIGLILLVVPILNFVVFPLLREYTPNMQKRIGMGYILAILSPLTLLIISSMGYVMLTAAGEDPSHSCFLHESASQVHIPINSWTVLLPHLVISLAEVFVMISSLEFFYAQSPHTMRGMMIGLFFFTWGIATVATNLFVIFFSHVQVTVLTCGVWYYLSLVLLAILTFILFLCVSRWYKNRKRGDIPPDPYYNPLTK